MNLQTVQDEVQDQSVALQRSTLVVVMEKVMGCLEFLHNTATTYVIVRLIIYLEYKARP